MRLFDVLGEDGAFGCETVFGLGEQLISRDLLDSVSEILFLERAITISSIPDLRVLDIGSGYGRLAHRMATALTNLSRHLCVDVVPESTFLAEYYLSFRGVDQIARAVPLDQVEAEVAEAPIHLAVNIHSFSESSLASIGWWLDLLVRHDIEHLLIVPNAESHGGHELLSTEHDGRRVDFTPAISERGFELVLDEPKYGEPALQQYGVSPTRRYLYQR